MHGGLKTFFVGAHKKWCGEVKVPYYSDFLKGSIFT